MPRDQREARAELTFVDVQIGAAQPTRVDAQQGLVRSDLGIGDLAVGKAAGGVVDNGFHGVGGGPSTGMASKRS